MFNTIFHPKVIESSRLNYDVIRCQEKTSNAFLLSFSHHNSLTNLDNL